MKDVRPTIAELEEILAQPGPCPIELTPAGEVVHKGLREQLQHAINCVSAENGSNTPDGILADYLVSCLAAFDRAVKQRERWYGYRMKPGMPNQIARDVPPESEGCSDG